MIYYLLVGRCQLKFSPMVPQSTSTKKCTIDRQPPTIYDHRQSKFQKCAVPYSLVFLSKHSVRWLSGLALLRMPDSCDDLVSIRYASDLRVQIRRRPREINTNVPNR